MGHAVVSAWCWALGAGPCILHVTGTVYKCALPFGPLLGRPVACPRLVVVQRRNAGRGFSHDVHCVLRTLSFGLVMGLPGGYLGLTWAWGLLLLPGVTCCCLGLGASNCCTMLNNLTNSDYL